MRGRSSRVLGPLAALAALVCLAAAAPAGSTRAAAPVKVMFVGDSVADALEYLPAAERSLGRGLDLTYDLRVCRRLASAGCPYLGAVPSSALDQVSAAGQRIGQVLVVDVGYNDDPAVYRKGMDDLVQTAGALGVKRIVWITLREAQPLYRQTNAVIRAGANRYPQVDVADWNSSSAGKPWFRSDGLHLTAGGATAFAAWLRPYLVQAAAEARATS